ncbi:MAG: L,D-transpeptidase [Rhodobacteraceae bacterium]|nr:L,D-transpeptidase [Paracoccaceae bacterium]
MARAPIQLALRALALLALALLAACAPEPPATDVATRLDVPGYGQVQDGEILIPAVPSDLLSDRNRRQLVAYRGSDGPGTIVIDPFARHLYLVLERGIAMRYRIAVGREGLGFRGTATVGRKEEWPYWQPTARMVARDPGMYGPYRGGLPGGLSNPLGARALYLYRGGRDSYYRIHGTNDIRSIGLATSAGCIRLFNQDILDLYGRVRPGAPVRVRTREESIVLEGPILITAGDPFAEASIAAATGTAPG